MLLEVRLHTHEVYEIREVKPQGELVLMQRQKEIREKGGNGEQERGMERVFSSKWVTSSCRLRSSSNLHRPSES